MAVWVAVLVRLGVPVLLRVPLPEGEPVSEGVPVGEADWLCVDDGEQIALAARRATAP